MEEQTIPIKKEVDGSGSEDEMEDEEEEEEANGGREETQTGRSVIRQRNVSNGIVFM